MSNPWPKIKNHKLLKPLTEAVSLLWILIAIFAAPTLLDTLSIITAGYVDIQTASQKTIECVKDAVESDDIDDGSLRGSIRSCYGQKNK